MNSLLSYIKTDKKNKIQIVIFFTNSFLSHQKRLRTVSIFSLDSGSYFCKKLRNFFYSFKTESFKTIEIRTAIARSNARQFFEVEYFGEDSEIAFFVVIDTLKIYGQN